MKSGDFGLRTKNYLFSRRPRKRLLPGFEWTSKPVKPFAQQLRAQPGKDIWMMGGGGIIASFLDEDEIDGFSIHVIPILIGEGIPLIQPRHLLNSSEAAIQQGVSGRGSGTELSGEAPFVEDRLTCPCRLEFSAPREWNKIYFSCPIPSPPSRQQQKRTGPVLARRSTCLPCTA